MLRCSGFSPTWCLSTEGLTFCECQHVFPSCSSSEPPCFSPGALSSRETPSVFIISLPGRKEEGCREQMHRNLLIVATLPRERVQCLSCFGFGVVEMGFVKMIMRRFMASVWMSWAGGWLEFRWTLFRWFSRRREGGDVGQSRGRVAAVARMWCSFDMRAAVLQFYAVWKWHFLLLVNNSLNSSCFIAVI